MRHGLHVIVSIAMWCLFGYYWRVVLGREIGPSTVRALLILAVTVIVGLLITLAWVGHNKRLARRFAGRRRQPRQSGPPALVQDTIGRAVIHPGLDGLRAAGVVDITADQEAKTYTVGHVEAPR